MVTTTTNLGAMFASFGAGFLIRYGKWNMIIANNILLLIAVGICLINNPWIILPGRFLYGMCAGTFTVLCPKFISEVAPTEYKGVFGAMS